MTDDKLAFSDPVVRVIKLRAPEGTAMGNRHVAGSVLASIVMMHGSPPGVAAEFATRDEAVALVKRAVAFIDRDGEAKAYAEFSRKGGAFHDRDLYITVLGLDGKVLAHGQRGDLIGQNLIEAKDPDGKLFIRERSDLAREHPSFWQNYKFMNPTTQTVEAKDMYCERLGETNVCGGVYKTAS